MIIIFFTITRGGGLPEKVEDTAFYTMIRSINGTFLDVEKFNYMF